MRVVDLRALTAPRSVAMVGATERPGALGRATCERLLGAGFPGAIGLVNPKRREVLGRPCAPSVAALPFAPDLGVVATPPGAAAGAVADLAAAGARAAVVITAGLDAAARAALRATARDAGIRILGPNCLGLQAPLAGLDASFAHLTARPGKLALLSQSGAIVTAMLDWAEGRGVGFSLVASLGDMSDVDVGDLLDHLADDPQTQAILMYLEHVTDARKFMSAARAAARAKPVIAVKTGRSEAAARAAASHTGALAGRDAVYDAAFARAGVLRVDDLTELFDAAETLARRRAAPGGRLAVVTNGGGAGVLAADAAAASGGAVTLAELAPPTLAALDAALPATWSGANPIDIIGDADAARYEAALSAALADPGVDAALAIACPVGVAPIAAAADAVARVAAAAGPAKPVIACILGEATAAEPRRRLEAAGIPAYDTPGRAVRGAAHLTRHAQAQRRLMRTPPSLPEGPEPDRATTRAVLEAALAEGREVLTEPEAKRVLEAYGVPTVATWTAPDPDAAGALAEAILAAGAEAAAVKILSVDITHKSDVGGVRLNLASAAEAREAAAAMIAQARARAPAARIDGVVVQPMVRRAGAQELILGLSDDPVFGPVALFGAGGVTVEAAADAALALAPLDAMLARDLIAQTRVGRLLEGVRGAAPADLDAVAGALVKLSQLAADFPEIRELDVNPLLADPGGAIALDARIRAAPAKPCAPGGNPRFAVRPYPSAWAGAAETAAGPVAIRPIRPEDEARFAAFFEQVSPEDLRTRFFGAIGRPSHELIARFTQIDYARAMAFIAEAPASGAVLGEARLVIAPGGARADFAVLTRSDLKRRGVGRALMARLIAYARAEGVTELVGDVLDVNGAMRSFCRGLGFQEADHPQDSAMQRFTLPLGPA